MADVVVAGLGVGIVQCLGMDLVANHTGWLGMGDTARRLPGRTARLYAASAGMVVLKIVSRVDLHACCCDGFIASASAQGRLECCCLLGMVKVECQEPGWSRVAESSASCSFL